MGLSATELGRKYGLNAQEMNRILVKEGFLTGKAGDYSPTEKALEYVTEKDYFRGNGGYTIYNRHWTTRSYDPSIMDVLNVTKEGISQVREEMKLDKLSRSNSYEKYPENISDKMIKSNEIINELTKGDNKGGKIAILAATGVVVGCLATGGVILYKYIKGKSNK